nr:YfcE family phosphodiesterase [Pseudonocardia endophytica]
MVHVLLISDTHVPTRASDLPDVVWEAVDVADVVVHAGDWMDPALLDRLEARAPRLVACWGNNDGDALRARLPETARVELGGVRVAVTHEAGAAQGRERRAVRAHPDTDLLVFGHSHIPWDSAAARPDGGELRLLNPGSPTDRRRQPTFTWMTVTLEGGRIDDVVLHHRAP